MIVCLQLTVMTLTVATVSCSLYDDDNCLFTADSDDTHCHHCQLFTVG